MVGWRGPAWSEFDEGVRLAILQSYLTESEVRCRGRTGARCRNESRAQERAGQSRAQAGSLLRRGSPLSPSLSPTRAGRRRARLARVPAVVLHIAHGVECGAR